MSKNVVTVLQGEQDAAERDSVFDFLYHDSRRIASFLSQFDENGLLTGITQGESVAKGAKRSKRVSIGGDVPIVGGGSFEFEIGPGESGTQSFDRTYDPFWTNARLFLDFLTERNMMQRNITEASIGQFVISSGFLSIHDLGMFKDAWKLPSIQRKMKSTPAGGQKISNMTAAQKAAAREEQENSSLFLDMIQIMPHAVHAQLITADEGNARLIWCTLNQEYLVSPPSDLTLAHGGTMAGEWSIMGVLSAYPEYASPDLDQQFDPELSGLTDSIVGQISKILTPIVRLTLGRPSAAYAITPLLIFREVA